MDATALRQGCLASGDRFPLQTFRRNVPTDFREVASPRRPRLGPLHFKTLTRSAAPGPAAIPRCIFRHEQFSEVVVRVAPLASGFSHSVDFGSFMRLD